MSDCLFCKIIAGEIPSAKVYEDELCYAFKDISPLAPMHFLVIPKQHFASAAEVTPENEAVVGHIYSVIAKLAKEQGFAAAELFKELGTPFIINQRKYSMFVRDIEKDGLKDYAAAHGIGIITFSPLAQGLLTDRYLHGIPEDSRVRTDGRFLKEAAIVEETLKKVRALNDLAAQRGQTLAQMALSWILRDGDITSVLIGASKPSQILDNIGIVHATSFSDEERRKIEEILA